MFIKLFDSWDKVEIFIQKFVYIFCEMFIAKVNYTICWVRLKSIWLFNHSPYFGNVVIVSSSKFISAIKPMFSCWPLFFTETVFIFSDIVCHRFVIWHAVSAFVGCSSATCWCFSLLISSWGSFIFCCCV